MRVASQPADAVILADALVAAAVADRQGRAGLHRPGALRLQVPGGVASQPVILPAVRVSRLAGHPRQSESAGQGSESSVNPSRVSSSRGFVGHPSHRTTAISLSVPGDARACTD